MAPIAADGPVEGWKGRLGPSVHVRMGSDLPRPAGACQSLLGPARAGQGPPEPENTENTETTEKH